MKKNLLIIASAVVSAALLSYVFREPINNIFVVPIGRMILIFQAYIESIPQFLIWIFIVVVLFVLMLKSFSGIREILQPRVRGLIRHKVGPVESWHDWVIRATTGKYYERKLASRISDLALSVFRFRYELPAEKLIEQLNSGSINITPKAMAYIQNGLNDEAIDGYRHHLLDQFSWIKSREQYQRVYLEVNEVVDALSDELKG